ncbi:capsid protein [Trichinella spiralis]|uniref:Capsid protein n=1 Tax=Trichinella spiralis TaxID=6334 RepID=A0ABR3K4J1_TRISP
MTARNQNKEMVRLIEVTVRKILNLQATSLWDKRIRQCRFGVIWHHRGPLTLGKHTFQLYLRIEGKKSLPTLPSALNFQKRQYSKVWSLAESTMKR